MTIITNYTHLSKYFFKWCNVYNITWLVRQLWILNLNWPSGNINITRWIMLAWFQDWDSWRRNASTKSLKVSWQLQQIDCKKSTIIYCVWTVIGGTESGISVLQVPYHYKCLSKLLLSISWTVVPMHEVTHGNISALWIRVAISLH